MVDNRTNNAKAIISSLRSTVGENIRVFRSEIPFSVRAAECNLSGESTFSYDRSGKIAAAYDALTKEVTEIEERAKIDLGLTGYDEFFMNDAERKENKFPRFYDIPLSEIDDFHGLPFKVKLDEDMDELVQSIKERGIVTPVTPRPKEDGRYEIVSGHRKKKACKLAGIDVVKAEVLEMPRDEVIILMVE